MKNFLLKPLFTPSDPEDGKVSLYKLWQDLSNAADVASSDGLEELWVTLSNNALKQDSIARSQSIAEFMKLPNWQRAVGAVMQVKSLLEESRAWMAKAKLTADTKRMVEEAWKTPRSAILTLSTWSASLPPAEETLRKELEAEQDVNKRNEMLRAEPSLPAILKKQKDIDRALGVIRDIKMEISFAELATDVSGKWSPRLGFAVATELTEESFCAYFSTTRVDFKPKNSAKLIEKTAAKEQSEIALASHKTLIGISGYLGAAVQLEVALEHAAVLSYDEYDAELIRSSVRRLSAGDPKKLIDLLLVSIYLGNNYIERAKKTMDPEAASSIIESLSVFELKRRKVNSGTITPSRASAAFPKVTLALRRELEIRGALPDAGVIVATPLLYQDLSFAGMSEELLAKGISVAPFLEAMAKKFIEAKRARDDKLKTTDEQAVKTMHQFREMAVKGHKRDIINSELDLNSSLAIAVAAYGFDSA